MARPIPIVYCHFVPWKLPPSRQQYLMESVSRHHPVYFLDMVPHRLGRLEFPRIERLSPNLALIQHPFNLRFRRHANRFPVLSSLIDSGFLRRILQRDGVGEYVYWLAASDFVLYRGMDHRRLVFDCIDPCFTGDYERFDFEEETIARRARVVFCTAAVLLEKMQRFNANCHLLPNAAPAEIYHPSVLQRLSPPDVRRPVVGYMGTLDWRFDADMVMAVARQMPEVTFVLTGRSVPDQVERIAPLRQCPNVVFTGPVDVEQGRAWVAAFDVGLIPFLTGPMGDAINPVKMYMYLAAGKPVVATWIRECRGYEPHVTATQTPADMVAAIRRALQPPLSTRGDERVCIGQQNTWDARADQALAVLQQVGLLSPPRR
ncbi:MAG TPA: glycosyltransferase [Candidatus Xenobia bacterium]|jgi:hypothetical protein